MACQMIQSQWKETVNWLEDNERKQDTRDIKPNLEPYKQFLFEKRALIKQQKLDVLFNLLEKAHKESNEAQASTSDVRSLHSQSRAEDNPASATSQ